MINKELEEKINQFLDGELSEQESSDVRRLIDINKEAKAYLEKTCRLKEVVSNMTFKAPSEDIMNEFWNNISSRLSRGFGWTFLIIGVAANIIYALYAFVLSNSINPFEKVIIFMVLSGLLLLFTSVAIQRYKDSKTDKYKGIVR
jgi:uncharacterized membrane protein